MKLHGLWIAGLMFSFSAFALPNAALGGAIFDGGFESGNFSNNHWGGSFGYDSYGNAEIRIASSVELTELLRTIGPTEGSRFGYGRATQVTPETHPLSNITYADARLLNYFSASNGQVLTGDYFSFLKSDFLVGSNSFADFRLGIYAAKTGTGPPDIGTLVAELVGYRVENGSLFSDWTSVSYTFNTSGQFWVVAEALSRGSGPNTNSIAAFGLDNFRLDDASLQFGDVPEPASLAMWSLGALGMMFALRKRQQKKLAA